MTEAYQISYIGQNGALRGVFEPWVLDPLEYPRQEEGKPVVPKAPDPDCPPGTDREDLTGVAEGTSTTRLGC
jgi:hypothetical protein